MKSGKHEKKPFSSMTLMLIALFITTVFFVAVCLAFTWFGRTVPDALIYSYFGAVTGECGAMGWIKTTQSRRWQVEDRDETNRN